MILISSRACLVSIRRSTHFDLCQLFLPSLFCFGLGWASNWTGNILFKVKRVSLCDWRKRPVAGDPICCFINDISWACYTSPFYWTCMVALLYNGLLGSFGSNPDYPLFVSFLLFDDRTELNTMRAHRNFFKFSHQFNEQKMELSRANTAMVCVLSYLN